jgi:putative FmdB family regulatory protein
MPLYSFRCQEHGEFDVVRSMANAARAETCACGREARRVFTVFLFQEDRTRQYYNSLDGTRKSYVTGQDMPDTRREYYQQLEAIGAEPVSKATEPVQWKENREYAEHVKTGGDRDTKFEKAAHPDSKPGNLTVLQQLKTSGVKIP